MIKKGSYKENFAEVLTSNIARFIGFNAISYEALNDGRLVKCKDFTNNAEVDFEPMYSFVQDYWEIDDSVKIIDELGYIDELLDIIFMDALCYNIDRHTFNFGILRKDGKPISLVPNFDNNLSFSSILDEKELESRWYSTSFSKINCIPTLTSYEYEVPNINMSDIENLIKETLQSFPSLKNEIGLDKTIFKIINNNYNGLKDIK